MFRKTTFVYKGDLKTVEWSTSDLQEAIVERVRYEYKIPESKLVYFEDSITKKIVQKVDLGLPEGHTLTVHVEPEDLSFMEFFTQFNCIMGVPVGFSDRDIE